MSLYFSNKSPLVAAARTLVLLLLSAWCLASEADEILPATGPSEVIGEVTTKIMALVGEAPDYFDDDPDRYINAVGKELDSVVDFRGFARGVMGEYASSARYKTLSDEGRDELRSQLNRFTTVLRDGMVNTYSRGLLAFGSSRIELGETEVSPGSARVASVSQYVYGEDGKIYTVKYQMGQYKDGSWKLRNLIIENINLGEIYRGQFEAAAVAAEGNLDMVIDTWDDSQIKTSATED
jgi:phospholipid transport system substrate-binding protein